MNELQYQQMLAREKAIVDGLNKKLNSCPSLRDYGRENRNLAEQLCLVSKRLDQEELWVLRDIVNQCIPYVKACEGLTMDSIDNGWKATAINNKNETLVAAMQLIAQATSPAHEDGAHHENAYVLAVEALNNCEAL